MSDRSMFYRVVLQGRAAGDRDMATVKREFARVTGMPQDVTERLFAHAPHPLKERVAQADAERIAVTLRAIGAAVTVERDLLASLDSVEGDAQEIMPPEHRGPPTVVPGSEAAAAPAPPTASQRMLRRLRPFLPYFIGIPLMIGALLLLAPFADDALRALQPVRTKPPEPPRPVPVEVAPAPLLPPNANVLNGPWRCTDQRTGLSTYWTFGADGTLVFHGDTFKEDPARTADGTVPTGWHYEDARLVMTFADKPPLSYPVSDMSLSRLRYGDGNETDIQCRRP
jgi:hypothetical protein